MVSVVAKLLTRRLASFHLHNIPHALLLIRSRLVPKGRVAVHDAHEEAG